MRVCVCKRVYRVLCRACLLCCTYCTYCIVWIAWVQPAHVFKETEKEKRTKKTHQAKGTCHQHCRNSGHGIIVSLARHCRLACLPGGSITTTASGVPSWARRDAPEPKTMYVREKGVFLFRHNDATRRRFRIKRWSKGEPLVRCNGGVWSGAHVILGREKNCRSWFVF